MNNIDENAIAIQQRKPADCMAHGVET